MTVSRLRYHVQGNGGLDVNYQDGIDDLYQRQRETAQNYDLYQAEDFWDQHPSVYSENAIHELSQQDNKLFRG